MSRMQQLSSRPLVYGLIAGALTLAPAPAAQAEGAMLANPTRAAVSSISVA